MFFIDDSSEMVVISQNAFENWKSRGEKQNNYKLFFGKNPD